MAGLCQECTACCTALEVKPLNKPMGHPCHHLGLTSFGQGCTIYEERPAECLGYVCLWLDSQRRRDVEKMPELMRPDICHVVMGWPYSKDRKALYIYPMPGHENAWRQPPISDYLQMILSRGAKVVVVMGNKRMAIKGDMAVIGTEEEFAELLA